MPTKPTEGGDALFGHARRGWFWGVADQFAQRGLTMIVTIVLARLIEPAAFGLIASVSIFLGVAQQLIDGGISQRVLQKSEIGDREYAALFWANGAVSFICGAALISVSGVIAGFFGYPELRGIISALAISLMLFNAGRVQMTWLIRELRFRTVSLISIVAITTGCVVGVAMAIMGYGVWSLIGQQLVLSVMRAVLLWSVVPYRPRGLPRWIDIRDLYAFGLPVVSSQVVRLACAQLINVLMVTRISATMLGFFDRGKIIPQNLAYSLVNLFGRSNFPALARLQSDEPAFARLFLRFLSVSSATYFMLLMGLAVCAENVVRVLLGDQWLPSVWFMQASCVAFMIYIVFTANAELLRAKGRTRDYFRHNMTCAFCQVTGVLAGMSWGAQGMVVGDIIGRAVSCLLIIPAVGKISDVTPIAQLRTLFFPLIGGLVVAAPLWGIQQLSGPEWARLFASGFVGLLLMLAYWQVMNRYGPFKQS